MDPDGLDEQIHKTHIIQQVLNLGTIAEFDELMRFYGFETVRHEIKKAGYFDPKTFSFVKSFFKLKDKELQCCIRKRLNQPHWH